MALTFKPVSPVAAKAGPRSAPLVETPTAKVVQNLLVHIPGEASGFYLMAIEFVRNPTTNRPETGPAFIVGILALVLLLVVRWLAGASRAVIATTVGAFLIWMIVLDVGFLHDYWRWGEGLAVVIAVFYSAMMTLLGSAGKIQ